LARAPGVLVAAWLCTLASLGWLGCNSPTATSLAQTSDGVSRTLPRAGDVLQLTPDSVEGEAVVDMPGGAGQPSLRIVTGTVKLDLAAKSTGFIMGPPEWAEVLVRFTISQKTPLHGTLKTANAMAAPVAFDAPGFQDANARIGFNVKTATIEQLPSGEVILFVRVAVRGLSTTTLMRISYQANLLWTPGGALPAAPTPPAPPPVGVPQGL
jgi:hypothetical protein